jgi:hypothetical protein
LDEGELRLPRWVLELEKIIEEAKIEGQHKAAKTEEKPTWMRTK